jgi:site-specific recombinase XerD
LKNGKPGLHPIEADELRLLRRLKREVGESPWMFLSRLRAPLTPRGANMIVTELGESAGLEFPIHFHCLRHSCGFALAGRGCDTRLIQDWLGHQNIQHTVRYTALAPHRFEGLWR